MGCRPRCSGLLINSQPACLPTSPLVAMAMPAARSHLYPQLLLVPEAPLLVAGEVGDGGSAGRDAVDLHLGSLQCSRRSGSCRRKPHRQRHADAVPLRCLTSPKWPANWMPCSRLLDSPRVMAARLTVEP